MMRRMLGGSSWAKSEREIREKEIAERGRNRMGSMDSRKKARNTQNYNERVEGFVYHGDTERYIVGPALVLFRVRRSA